MKRITILILSLVLLLLLSACAPEIGSTGTFDSSEMPHTEDISEPGEADKAGADTNSKVNEQQMTYEKFDFDKKTVRLNKMYVAKLFDWFDAIQETSIRTKMNKIRWSTETIERDRLFLQRLGILTE